MNLNELIEELQRKREIVIEQGLDPSGISVVVPVVERTKLTVWEEVVDSEMVKMDRGTIVDLQLLGDRR